LNTAKTTMTTPQLELAYTTTVTLVERRDLGTTNGGHHDLIDITGGHFEGPRPRGTVLHASVDCPRLRPDGVKELDALDDMPTGDGTVPTVHNRVFVGTLEPLPPEQKAERIHVDVLL
jgi:Protein of unknown function (DUF3237)